MHLTLPKFYRRQKLCRLQLAVSISILVGIFFLAIFTNGGQKIIQLLSPLPDKSQQINKEVLGFAPYWTLSKLDNVDWDMLSTFAYFSLPILADGTIDRTSYEWDVFGGNRLEGLFAKAKKHNVRRVITLTQMERAPIEEFLASEESWKTLARETSEILKVKKLDGVNVDIEYTARDDEMRDKFSNFMDYFTSTVRAEVPDSYITVSVLASSVRFNKIYDIGRLAKTTDGVMMMAYDFYYPGSENAGPSAPLYGYNNGRGPYWYDVSTAVEDFLKVADASKIIMGVPYYGWDYPTASPEPTSARSRGAAFATTNEYAQENELISTTPIGGWDENAQVSWRAYWDVDGWHVVYLENNKSLSKKYDFALSKNLAGVGIWALGYDRGDDSLWAALRNSFSEENSLALTN